MTQSACDILDVHAFRRTAGTSPSALFSQAAGTPGAWDVIDDLRISIEPRQNAESEM